jgi:polyribonucleotide nucleotidyltransferase
VVKVGDEIMVMVIDIDPEGKIRLSRQAVMAGWTAEEARERDHGSRGGGARGPSSSGSSFRPRDRSGPGQRRP